MLTKAITNTCFCTLPDKCRTDKYLNSPLPCEVAYISPGGQEIGEGCGKSYFSETLERGQ